MKKHLPLISVLLSLGSMMVLLIVFAVTRPPQTVMFDIRGTLDRYQEQLLEAGFSDDQHRSQLATFDHHLRRILEEYAQTHHLTIVVPAAVIAGAPDMTATLQHHIIEEMKSLKSKEP